MKQNNLNKNKTTENMSSLFADFIEMRKKMSVRIKQPLKYVFILPEMRMQDIGRHYMLHS